MPRPGTQALVVSRADKIVISALFASSLVRNNISCGRITQHTTMTNYQPFLQAKKVFVITRWSYYWFGPKAGFRHKTVLF